ncbi:hypothetical protein ACFQ14_00275 [Pseudahrensia aquimaris]|uniref:DUF8173 domain-containing protein n=1 Tax=Pseudahrensia aquimaris TaxID=744461 RepID=A0ABW3FC30_9HYPH
MFRTIFYIGVLMVSITTAFAQEKKSDFEFSNDRFLAGATVVQSNTGVDDLFMFGETVRSEKDIVGSAHLFGRKVEVSGTVGGDAYLAGMDVTLASKVAGDANISGYNVSVAEVVGDLRASGSNVTIAGPVSGYALIAGDEVRFESVIKGDVSLTARDIEFSEDARIEGRLIFYEETKGETTFPVGFIAEDRIERREFAEWSKAAQELEVFNWREALMSFLIWIVVVAGIASLIAAIIPQKLADLRRTILDRPFRTLWFGILAQSAVIGVTILLIMTLIGLLLAPATILVALVCGFAGYVVAAYALGVALLKTVGREEPDSVGTRALAAGVGALTVGLIGLIPFFGWLFVLSLALTGVGAIALWLFEPKFFVTARLPSA